MRLFYKCLSSVHTSFCDSFVAKLASHLPSFKVKRAVII